MTWRNVAIVLALASAWLLWRDCRRPSANTSDAAVECTPDEQGGGDHTSSRRSREASRDGQANGERSGDATGAEQAGKTAGGFSMHGFTVPSWALGLLPQPGENLLAYRDRIVPLAQVAIAPHRQRVARGRDDFAKAVGLDANQRTELDTAVQEAATQIQDRVLGAALSGEFSPATFKPMGGVALARELLDVVERANRRFLATLREDQRARLAQHPFDLADYLLFSTKWEDALGYAEN